MKKLMLSTSLVFALASLSASAQVGQDLKNAGTDTKDAVKTGSKKTANGTKKAYKATKKGVKKGTNKVAGATEKGADKVQDKTSSNPK